MSIRFRPILSLLVLILSAGALHAQPRSIVTSYGDAILATPINLTIGFLPQGRLLPHVSGSGEYVVRLQDESALGVGAGFYVVPEGHETIGSVGWRQFADLHAPIGSYYEIAVIGGAARITGEPALRPIYGAQFRIGSLRESRFSSFAFGYSLGPSVMLIGSQVHLRLNFNFGLGFLLGKVTEIR